MKTENKYTAGPWKTSLPYIKTENSLGWLAMVSNNPQSTADANLIACAPDLLESLKHLVSVAHKLDQSATSEGLALCQILANARHVISKAEGENI